MENSKRNQTIKSHGFYGNLMFRLTLFRIVKTKNMRAAQSSGMPTPDNNLCLLFYLCSVSLSLRRHKPNRSSTRMTYLFNILMFCSKCTILCNKKVCGERQADNARESEVFKSIGVTVISLDSNKTGRRTNGKGEGNNDDCLSVCQFC